MQTKLYLMKPSLITTIQTPGAPELGSLLLRQRNGTLWSAANKLTSFEADGQKTIAILSNANTFGLAEALGEDRNGNILLSDRAYHGVRVLKGHLIVASPPYSAVTGDVRVIFMDSAGEQWFGTTTGLFHAQGSRISHLTQADGLPGTSVRTMIETEPGRLWVGTNEGPAILVDGKLQRVLSGTKWTFGDIWAMAEDSAGIVWMTTNENKLIRYDHDDFQVFDEADGLPTLDLFSVDVSDEQALWLRTDAGLIRVGKKSLMRKAQNRSRELEITEFDEADGLPSRIMSPSGNQGSLHFPDGTIWFSSIGGIASLQPRRIKLGSPDLHALIEEHVIDQSGLLPSSADEGISMKPGQTSLEIHYTALGSLHPEQVRFRYQLVGIDKDWVSAQDRRVAYYTHLPPGGYIFRIQAASIDQEGWTLPEAHVPVKVLTPFYQSWWMKCLVILAVALAASLIVEIRRRRVLQAQHIRQAFTHRLIASQESERKRIAHELHDGLGQHLVLIRTLALLPAKLRASRVQAQGQTQKDAPASEDPLLLIAEQAAVAIFYRRRSTSASAAMCSRAPQSPTSPRVSALPAAAAISAKPCSRYCNRASKNKPFLKN